MDAAEPKPRFIISKRFASGHRCGVIFGPDDWKRTFGVTQQWHHRGWCTWEERQLFVNEMWRLLERHKQGREWAEFIASMIGGNHGND